MPEIQKSLFYPYTIDKVHSGFSIDCVILSFHKKNLRILLNKFNVTGFWQLPGGFMFNHESPDEAAKRILYQRTGLNDIFLKQFYLFGDPNREDSVWNTNYLKMNKDSNGFTDDEIEWFSQRFISLGYYGLVKYEDITLSKVKEDMTKWFAIDNLPPLYSDHENIIKTALENIRASLPVIPIGYEVLPEKFGISDLRRVYEIVLGRSLDRRNFLRKMLSIEAIVRLEEKRNASSFKNAAILYEFEKGRKDVIDNSFFL